MANCEGCRHLHGCPATRWEPAEIWCELNNDPDECEDFEYYDEYLEFCKEQDAKLRGFEKA